MANRRPAYQSFTSERRAAFGAKVRNAFLDEGRSQKDVERARMEAYRKLCKEEGITSQRLAEYDETRKKASEELAAQLEAVDYDQSLTNNEKKRKKFSLKRKFAATTVSGLLEKKEKTYSAVTAAEKIGKKRLAEKEAALSAKKRRESEKKEKQAARKARNQLYAQRTKKGQPILASRMESLLERVNKLNRE